MSRLFVQNLTTLDFAYLHGERGLLGESWRVHVELEGGLDHQGMVQDFSLVKKGIKGALDVRFDHCLLVPLQHSGLAIDVGDETNLRFVLASGEEIVHLSPPQAVTGIPGEVISTEGVAKAAIEVLRPLLPGNVDGLRLQLEPERIDSAYFHYAHGLKHHDGNCQRIAHGHRSRIEIHRDGRRDIAQEQRWAGRFRDITIVTREDIVAEDEQRITHGYTSGQGAFSLSLPRRCCYIVDEDSTIENLAQHVADRTANELPGSRIEARVFEGIDKGAWGVGVTNA